jgi:hypothetical protein
MRDLCPGSTFTLCAINDLVVNIGDVGDKPNIQPSIGEVATQDVVDHRGPPMAKVRGAIHRGPAEVDADAPRLPKSEGFDAASGGVIEVQHSVKPTI